MIINLFLMFQQFSLVILMQVFLLKKCVLCFILDDEEKREVSRGTTAGCKTLTESHQNMWRENCLSSQNFNVEVPKKRKCTRNCKEGGKVPQKVLHSVRPESFS